VDESAGDCARTWPSSLRGSPPGSMGVRERSTAKAGSAQATTKPPWLKKPPKNGEPRWNFVFGEPR
jgi:hypothetical protein